MKFNLNLIRKLFPWLTPSPNIIVAYVIDAFRFSRFNNNNSYRTTRKKHLAQLIRACHGLEKAFSLPSVKEKFGCKNAGVLIDEIGSFVNNHGFDEYVFVAMSVLKEYFHHHENMDSNSLKELRCRYEKLKKKVLVADSQREGLGGMILLPNQDVFDEAAFTKFFESRYSVRNFQEKAVNLDIVQEVIKTSLKTPSACNRQSWSVHLYQGKKKASEILSYQYGNRGFGEHVQNVMLVTGHLSSFSSKERNQVYIDGGLVCMSIMLAMHSHNLSTCPLNTAYHWYEESRLRKGISLDDDEVPIMMIAFGYAAKDTKCAISHRRSVEEVLVHH